MRFLCKSFHSLPTHIQHFKHRNYLKPNTHGESVAQIQSCCRTSATEIHRLSVDYPSVARVTVIFKLYLVLNKTFYSSRLFFPKIKLTFAMD